MDRVVADRFVLEEYIGEGSQAEVWRATDCQSPDRPHSVTLKFFRPATRSTGDVPWQVVRNELKAALRIPPHPGVVTAQAILKSRHFQNEETPALMMRHVEATNLAEWLLTLGRIEQHQLNSKLAVLGGVLVALAHIHESGVVHRDLSFGNILVQSGTVPHGLLTDFGSSQTTEPLAVERPATDCPSMLQPINPPPYTVESPLSDGFRRDLYAFAVLCYLTLVGRHPLTDNWQQMRTGMWKGIDAPHANLPRRRITSLVPWGPDTPELCRLDNPLLQCLSQDDDNHLGRAEELKRLWLQIQSSEDLGHKNESARDYNRECP